jgi:hypothetical protein
MLNLHKYKNFSMKKLLLLSLILLSLTPMAFSITPDGNHVGVWRLDENMGVTINDASSNGNDGTLEGGTWYSGSNCISGSCLYFDGVDDRVVIPDDVLGSMDLGTQWTIIFWGRYLTSANEWAILKHEGGGWNPYGVLFKGDNQAEGTVRISTTLYGTSTSSDVPTTDWYCIAVVRDVTDFDIYVDGVLKGSNTISSGDTRDSNSPLYFAYIHEGYAYTPQYSEIWLDEIEISNINRPLSYIQDACFSPLTTTTTTPSTTTPLPTTEDACSSLSITFDQGILVLMETSLEYVINLLICWKWVWIFLFLISIAMLLFYMFSRVKNF